ncbi:MAG: 50S ribosomal protein L6 [Flavobacteriales bacterium]|nr:50S ribosomal protein L6 [Flavobacteriales bacterium]
MSRIGKAIIEIPEGVEINISEDNIVSVKGKLGELSEKIYADLEVSITEGVLEVKRSSESKVHKAQHGLSRALIANMVEGVSTGYSIEQELVGVGYRAKNSGQVLELALGFSHPIIFEVPSEVKVSTVSEKGKNPQIKLESMDKQLVGQVAAKIRSFRKPEPYKGKGVRFKGEEVRKKAGKTAG